MGHNKKRFLCVDGQEVRGKVRFDVIASDAHTLGRLPTRPQICTLGNLCLPASRERSETSARASRTCLCQTSPKRRNDP